MGRKASLCKSKVVKKSCKRAVWKGGMCSHCYAAANRPHVHAVASGPSVSPPSQDMDTPCRKKILLFGDSITQFGFCPENIGWGTHLANRFERHADVILRGFSGYNSCWALDMLRTGILTPRNPDVYDVATIFFGANDSVLADASQHCPLEEYQQNISSIVEALRQHNPEIQLLLITPGDVDHAQWDTRHTDQVAQYATAVREVGVVLRVPVVDLWSGDNAVSPSCGDLSDGLHLSPSGNAKVFKAVMDVMESSYPGSIPVVEHSHFPLWGDLAGKSAQETREILQNWSWRDNKL